MTLGTAIRRRRAAAAALQMFLFACVGVAMEVAFTAATDVAERRDPRLMGYTYLWMFPVYAAVPVLLSLLHPPMAAWP